LEGFSYRKGGSPGVGTGGDNQGRVKGRLPDSPPKAQNGLLSCQWGEISPLEAKKRTNSKRKERVVVKKTGLRRKSLALIFLGTGVRIRGRIPGLESWGVAKYFRSISKWGEISRSPENHFRPPLVQGPKERLPLKSSKGFHWSVNSLEMIKGTSG